jgi:hypothetical protein
MPEQPTTPYFPELVKINAFKTQLLKLPDDLYHARLELADLTDQWRAAKDEVAELEAECKALIRAETVDELSEITGKVVSRKPKYPNDQARDAALDRALPESGGYQSAKKFLRGRETDKTRAEFQVKRLEEQHRSVAYVADLTCAEVSLLVAGRK